jgi:ATP-dependent DNA helicase RecQ
MKKAVDVLKEYWGYTSFRPLQEDIIDEIVNKKDVLALMPTGGGKSITFQVPGLMLEGVVIVVSPLIALIKDQVANLKERNIAAEYIVSGMDFREIDRILDNCIFGDIKFLYVSPERLKSELFIERFKQMKTAFIAVDEAHCISQWGYDFRPSYLQISEIRQFQDQAAILALTASATPDVVEDIQEKLSFKKKNVLSTSFNRENLHYVVIEDENKRQRILRGIKARSGTGIIYVRSRKLTRELALWLKSNGVDAAPYHAGLSPEIKDKTQQEWKEEKCRIIVATNAFGMGIDKANVRTVIHYDLPESLEAYFQEAGRAGRDGLRAYAVLVFNQNDISALKERIERSYPDINVIKSVYDGIANYYRLAFGSGMDETFNFDIVAISERLNLAILEVFNSIKILERTGYYHLSDSLHQPSKLKIKVNQAELYYFEVANSKHETLLKTLLRSYSGLFDSYVKINEYLIAKRVRIEVNELIKQLKYLDSIELIDYLPANTKPTITFIRERIPKEHISISYESYGALKEQQLKRSESMIGYVRNETCRNIQLLSYFGEKTDIECGKCDVCLRKMRKNTSIQELEDELIKLVKHKAINLKDLLAKMPRIEEERVLDILRYLADEGLVSTFDNKWKWNGH